MLFFFNILQFGTFLVWDIRQPIQSMTNNRIVIYSPRRSSALIIKEIAKQSCCEVKHCFSTEQTINATLATQPFLIIILCIAPIINGERLIPRLRNTSKQRTTILVIAWQQSEHTILRLLDAGVDQYMTFPMCMTRLYGKISYLLNNLRWWMYYT